MFVALTLAGARLFLTSTRFFSKDGSAWTFVRGRALSAMSKLGQKADAGAMVEFFLCAQYYRREAADALLKLEDLALNAMSGHMQKIAEMAILRNEDKNFTASACRLLGAFARGERIPNAIAAMKGWLSDEFKGKDDMHPSMREYSYAPCILSAVAFAFDKLRGQAGSGVQQIPTTADLLGHNRAIVRSGVCEVSSCPVSVHMHL